ncbi:MAG: DUF3467 domain-containing protein [Planctomycetaceae bacterium]|jgi:hypothetical protein|nr:DUF3467 domain-containing protein [Planctomycetaceae bacterium]
MSGDIPNKTEPSTGQQLQLDDSKATADYVNYCRITGTPEEIIIDFGLNPQPLGPNQQQPVVVSNRIVTSFYTAKRMLFTLQSAIQRHENAFGEIEVDVQKRIVNRPQ